MSRKSQTKEKSTKAAPTTESVQGDSPDKIERIRDLILSPYIRDLNQRFTTISKDVTRLEGELTRVTEDLREQGNQLQNTIQEAEKRIMTQLHEGVSGNEDRIAEADTRISGRIGDLEKQFMTRLQELVEDLRELEQASRTELRETVSEVEQAKVDRFSLGELFSQLGNGLKSSQPEDEITALLNELQQEIG